MVVSDPHTYKEDVCIFFSDNFCSYLLYFERIMMKHSSYFDRFSFILVCFAFLRHLTFKRCLSFLAKEKYSMQKQYYLH